MNETQTQTQIADKLDELRNHRADGVATTTDLIRILEIMEGIANEMPLVRRRHQ